MSEQLKKSSHKADIKNIHDYCVRIPFTKTANDMDDMDTVNDNINNWNECCAKAIELFGLPDKKYTCRFTEQAIEFWFLEEKDALLFELCCG
jgi:hypothetical protein